MVQAFQRVDLVRMSTWKEDVRFLRSLGWNPTSYFLFANTVCLFFALDPFGYLPKNDRRQQQCQTSLMCDDVFLRV